MVWVSQVLGAGEVTSCHSCHSVPGEPGVPWPGLSLEPDSPVSTKTEQRLGMQWGMGWKDVIFFKANLKQQAEKQKNPPKDSRKLSMASCIAMQWKFVLYFWWQMNTGKKTEWQGRARGYWLLVCKNHESSWITLDRISSRCHLALPYKVRKILDVLVTEGATYDVKADTSVDEIIRHFNQKGVYYEAPWQL